MAEAYVSSIQFSNGRRPDAFLEALGGPSPLKIPGIIRADLISGQVVIRWSGGVALQSADSLAGPWTTVSGTPVNPATHRRLWPRASSIVRRYRRWEAWLVRQDETAEPSLVELLIAGGLLWNSAGLRPSRKVWPEPVLLSL